MDLGKMDFNEAVTEYPVFSAKSSGTNTVLGDFNGLFVNSHALRNAPSIASDVEPYLKYQAAASVIFDTGININFLPGLAQIQRDKPAVYIGSGTKKNALLHAAGKAVEIYNTGPAPLCPKNEITVAPPLVKPAVAPAFLTSASDGAIPVYPLSTLERYRFEADLNKLIDIVRTIADCEYSIDSAAATNSFLYVSALSVYIFESLTGNSLWAAMVRTVSDHSGAVENEDIMRHMLRIFKEHWYPYLNASKQNNHDDYMFATNTDMFSSLIEYVNEHMNNLDIGHGVRGLERLNYQNGIEGDEPQINALKRLWTNRLNTYRLFPALATRLQKFQAIDCGYIQSSASESGVIGPGGRMLIILPH